jgi:hypothetical protein
MGIKNVIQPNKYSLFKAIEDKKKNKMTKRTPNIVVAITPAGKKVPAIKPLMQPTPEGPRLSTREFSCQNVPYCHPGLVSVQKRRL